MIIIEKTRLPNGAYMNQSPRGIYEVPDNYWIVPEHLEEAARQYLPFALLDIEDGEIVGIRDNPEKPPPVEPPEPPKYTSFEKDEFLTGFMEGVGYEQGA